MHFAMARPSRIAVCTPIHPRSHEESPESTRRWLARPMHCRGMRPVSQHHVTELGKPVARALAIATTIVALAAVWAWWAQYEQRALLSLPAEERVRIYERSLESMRVLCGNPKITGAFESRCREHALFLAEFPECGTDCRALLENYLPRPSR